MTHYCDYDECACSDGNACECVCDNCTTTRAQYRSHPPQTRYRSSADPFSGDREASSLRDQGFSPEEAARVTLGRPLPEHASEAHIADRARQVRALLAQLRQDADRAEASLLVAERLTHRAAALRHEPDRQRTCSEEASRLVNESAALVRLRFETRTGSLIDAVLEAHAPPEPPPKKKRKATA